MHTDRTDRTDLVRGEGAHGGLEHEIFLNTNNANDTNIHLAHGSHGLHGSFTLEFFEHE